MGIANLPAIVRAAPALASRAPTMTGTLIQGAARTAPVAVQRAPITVEGVSRTINALPKTSPFYKKKVVVGGAAVTVSALAGMGAAELFETLNAATPDEIQAMMIEADNNGAAEVSDELEFIYNSHLTGGDSGALYVDRSALSPSRADQNMVAVDNIQRSGLGLSFEEVDRQQVLSRAYRSLRSTFTLEDLFALRLFVTTASDEDIMALEDIYLG